MYKCCVFVGVLIIFTLSFPGHSQEVGQTGTAPQEAPSKSPASRPSIPRDITFSSSLGDVLFPHKLHMKMGCKKCHHQIHAKELLTPHEEYLTYSWVSCQDCHNKASETNVTYYGCADCHHSNLENIADETLTAKVVVHKSCWKCHMSGTGVEASERCGFCHLEEEKSNELSREIVDH